MEFRIQASSPCSDAKIVRLRELYVEEAQRRWNWINGWLTAALHACIEGVGLEPREDLTIRELLEVYAEQVRRRLQDAQEQGVRAQTWEIEYIFQLEEELWGSDAETYETFFPKGRGKNELPLQTFHFVLLFYILERCLKLFIREAERYKIGHGKLRQEIFGHEKGLFSEQAVWATQAIGLPFSLLGSSSRVEELCSTGGAWEALKRCQVPKKLEEFYFATTGKKHFAEVLEAALKQARKDHLRKKFGRTGKRLRTGVRAWWYDVLWHYSESVRYHALVPSGMTMQQPFYWNRTVRWFGSVALTGLLLVAEQMGVGVGRVWERRSGRITQLLGGRRRFFGGG